MNKQEYEELIKDAVQQDFFPVVYGYARISRRSQNIERQLRNIKDHYPSAVLMQEAYTGRSLNRPVWNRLYKTICDEVANKEVTVVFDSVSRMSRDAEEGTELYMRLYEMGVNLVFLKEPHINTDTYKKALNSQIERPDGTVGVLIDGVNNFLKELAKEQIRIAFEQSQKEVDDLRQRTREGILTAKVNGKQVGLPKGSKIETQKAKESKKLIQKHCRDFGGSLTDAEAMKLIGISKNSYYKYKREMVESKI